MRIWPILYKVFFKLMVRLIYDKPMVLAKFCWNLAITGIDFRLIVNFVLSVDSSITFLNDLCAPHKKRKAIYTLLKFVFCQSSLGL